MIARRAPLGHRAPHALNPTAQPDELAGGRFDSLDGSHAYLYLADSPDGAIAETICRDLPLDRSIARIVPPSTVTGRTLTALTVTRTLTTAALHGPHLASVGQDLWLTKCEARHYVTTRRWAHTIRAADNDIDGLAYRPRHNEDTLAWILTTDPAITPHVDLAIDPTTTSLPLDHGPGRDLVARIIADHSALLSPTRPTSDVPQHPAARLRWPGESGTAGIHQLPQLLQHPRPEVRAIHHVLKHLARGRVPSTGACTTRSEIRIRKSRKIFGYNKFA
ncbi:RES family NAD+ phosphorylase [Rhodococcus opacus]|uniref:RES family NAD+ phosphorylase n=1 Tax=Rhodococcus opacus TaxID=37919 RepID=UPI0034D1E214